MAEHAGQQSRAGQLSRSLCLADGRRDDDTEHSRVSCIASASLSVWVQGQRSLTLTCRPFEESELSTKLSTIPLMVLHFLH